MKVKLKVNMKVKLKVNMKVKLKVKVKVEVKVTVSLLFFQSIYENSEYAICNIGERNSGGEANDI
jgi:hypothetical protein